MLKPAPNATATESELFNLEKGLLAFTLSGSDPARVLEDMTPGDFLNPGCAALFDFLQKRHRAGLPVDSQPVLEALVEADPAKIVDRIGGYEGFCSLTSSYHAALSPETIGNYIRSVKRGSLGFQQRRVMAELDCAIRGGDLDRSDALRDRLQALFDRSAALDSKKQAALYALESADLIWLRAQKAIAEDAERSGPLGLTFGIPTLDDALAPGLRAGRFLVLGALTSQGKSVLALQLALDTARRGLGALYLSWEMPPEELLERAAAMETRVDAWRIQKRRFDSERQRQELGSYIPPAGLLIPSVAGLKAGRIPRLVKDARDWLAKRELPLSLLIVDHLQLVRSSDKTETRAYELQAIADLCKELAMSGAGGSPLAVLGLSQLNRATEKESPEMSNLKDSSGLEQAADIVILVSWNREKNEVKACIKKFRGGPTGQEPKMKFNPARLRFE